MKDAAADYEQEKAELRLWLKVAQDDEEFMNPEILITKVDGSASYHGDTQAPLRRLNREDLNSLYRLINMLVEKKYPLMKELLEKMLNLQLEAKEESTMAFELLKFIKSQIEE
ncbi:hypothetical protein Tco_0953502 [Tanacetum coccineum]|uniref:Uncharacterized protein n=1 Tax=Tanacetum coccineum TaxID=301880 RepID=A0ABQ5E036_9ASTR